ncbi:MAG TPA: type II toxin-antitoxin system RelE/ParE family toxin [Mucilaginibacter sp.]|nr:type II toxin-antitoxin system RelE/ParE family toxin [Mucilaginibacter sp.]
MTYAITFSKHALKDLERINEPFYSNIKQAIIELSQNPRPNGCKKLKGRAGYRIRVGNYRVIYDIFDSQLLVDIITLGHRKDIYE